MELRLFQELRQRAAIAQVGSLIFLAAFRWYMCARRTLMQAAAHRRASRIGR